MALGKAEGQIQTLKDKSLEVAAEVKTETSVVEILRLWQQVFRETFQQYHRLSSRLIRNEDGAVALRLWQEYLTYVQQFLNESIPSDPHSLSEHRHLCEVHQNLLATQQKVLNPTRKDSKLAGELVELSVMEKFNSLTNLHNETLSGIMKRHKKVTDRLNAWEKYRQDQNRLLAWLRSLEKERSKMHLRYVHVRRIPLVIQRIRGLLGKIPEGEAQAENLKAQQDALLQHCDDAISTSVKMEHVAITQRMSNLQAGLNTWTQFLERVQSLMVAHEENSARIQNVLDSVQDVVSEIAAETPTTHSAVSGKLESLRRTRSRLKDLTGDLENLRVTQEQLKECVSPGDVKSINQKIWLLWHQQEDLDHQLAVLCHRFEDKLGLRSMFEARRGRFVSWADDLEKRIDKESESGALNMKDPEEILRKLETELEAEMALKEREYGWLVLTGNELIDTCGEEYSDVVIKQSLQAQTREVQERWVRLESLGKARANKIHDMMETMSQLRVRIARIRVWLSEVEVKLSELIVLEGAEREVVDRKLQEHDKLRKSIEKESGDVGEVLNLCELLLSDADVWNAHFDTESITTAVQNLERRWKNVCGLSAERKRKITFVWNSMQELLKLAREQENWLAEQEKNLETLENLPEKVGREELQETVDRVRHKMKKIESRRPAFEIIEQTYSKVAKASGIDPVSVQTLTAEVRVLLDRWHKLEPRARDVLDKLQEKSELYSEFYLAHEASVVGLTKIDAILTEVEHLAGKSAPEERMDRIVVSTEKIFTFSFFEFFFFFTLQEIESKLNRQNPTLENADKLGLMIMETCREDEISTVQELIDEYQTLWANVRRRVNSTRASLEKQLRRSGGRRGEEVDEGVQVETLKFERDTAVQVNTLQRMTSISAKDAYVMELINAIDECTVNVSELERCVVQEVPQQGSPELHTEGKKIAKLTATCQSSIELVEHLREVLVSECDADEDEARGEEVEFLVGKFKGLLVKAKEKEQKIRELR